MRKDKTTGQLLKEIRKARGLTQMQLSEKIGVSYQQVQKYEKGMDRISVDRLKQIARAVGVPVSTFFSAENEMTAEPPALYGKIGDEEQELLQLYRRIKDKKLKSAVLALLRSLARG